MKNLRYRWADYFGGVKLKPIIYISLFAVIGLWVTGILSDSPFKAKNKNINSLIDKQASINNQKTNLPNLNGEKAISHLLKGGMYSSLGEAMTAARYKAEKTGKRVVAFNHNNRMKAEFDEGGLKLSSTSETVKWESRWRMQSVGYGNEQTEIKQGELTSKGQRVEIRREEMNLVEWFENRPSGLEHGFTLSERPEAKQTTAESLRLVMEVSGDLQVKANKDGQKLTLTGIGGKEVLRYKKLRVWDADKKELAARMEASDNKVILEVEEADAKYPLIIDPTFEIIKLISPDGEAGDIFGGLVSISGNTVIIGAPQDDDQGSKSGSAYIFERDENGVWNEGTKLLESDGASFHGFGRAVSISGDTAIVGAPGGEFQTLGSASIFVRDGNGDWNEQTKIRAPDGVDGASFGIRVSIFGDTVIVVGASSAGEIRPRTAYVFIRDENGDWNEEARLLASDGGREDQFGVSVSISGNTVIVGAPRADGVVSASGAAYIFARDGNGVWSEEAKLTASDGAVVDLFGWSVSISGETVIIGAKWDNNNGFRSGSAYIFIKDGNGNWSENSKLTASDGAAGDEFGTSVAISGNTVIVGSPFDDDNGSASGAAYIFVRDGNGDWNEEAKLTASDSATNSLFGESVSISEDSVIVGAPNDDDNGFRSGSAYIFLVNPIKSVIDKIVADGGLRPSLGNALINKLNLAFKQLAKGNINAAFNKLNDVIVQTQNLIASGEISVEDGQAIIDAVETFIATISG